MLSWIPLIGPIIQGIVSIFTKAMDTKVETLKTIRTADGQEAQVSAQIIHDTSDDICLRIMRDAVCLPVALWTMIIGWDTIMIRHYPQYTWVVEKYPDSVSYLPYMVLVFLFGNIGLNMWNRK